MEMERMEKIEPEIQMDDKEIEKIIATWHKYDHAYFWRPAGSSSARRGEEKRNSKSYTGSYKGHDIDVQIRMSQSCHNVYVTRECYIDGEQKTIRSLTTLFNH